MTAIFNDNIQILQKYAWLLNTISWIPKAMSSVKLLIKITKSNSY